jgi:hypothetical protein
MRERPGCGRDGDRIVSGWSAGGTRTGIVMSVAKATAARNRKEQDGGESPGEFLSLSPGQVASHNQQSRKSRKRKDPG